MFKLALLSDIHGNLTALERVMKDVAVEAPDRIVCLGDVAAMGPDPVAVINRLRALEADYVMGNTDAFLIDPPPLEQGIELSLIEEIERWSAEQLNDEARSFLGSFQPTVTFDLSDDLTFLGFHGTPTSNLEVIDAGTPEEELNKHFQGSPQQVLAGGHSHIQLVRRFQDRYLVNPGSIGLPFETDAKGEVHNPARAEYAIVEAAGTSISIDLRRVPFDVELVSQRFRDSGMPHAEQVAAGWRA